MPIDSHGSPMSAIKSSQIITGLDFFFPPSPLLAFFYNQNNPNQAQVTNKGVDSTVSSNTTVEPEQERGGKANTDSLDMSNTKFSTMYAWIEQLYNFFKKQHTKINK